MSDGMSLSATVPIRDLPDHLLANGHPVITTERAADLTGLNRRSIHAGLTRLKSKGRIFSPARGLYVPIPPEYRSWRVVPAEWFVDAMMRHLHRRYYVGLLSAAAIHGASHHAPQVFQVMVDRQIGDRDLERVRLRFHVNRLLEHHALALPVQTRNTHTGTIVVASPELTAVDIARHPRSSGGLHNVANVLVELPRLDENELGGLAALYPRVVARRLGWLLETFADYTDLERLRAVAAPHDGQPVPLSASGPRRGRRDDHWGLIINAAVEPEVEPEVEGPDLR